MLHSSSICFGSRFSKKSCPGAKRNFAQFFFKGRKWRGKGIGKKRGEEYFAGAGHCNSIPFFG